MPPSDKPTPPQSKSRGWLARTGQALLNAPSKLLDWIGVHQLRVFILLLVAMLAMWIFVAIADEVAEGDTSRFDQWAVRALRRADDPSKPIGPGWVAEAARDLTALGGVAFLSLLTLAVLGFLFLRRMYGAMGLVLMATVGGAIINILLKHLIDRPRPDLVPHLSMVYTSSFPSGHSMLSATVFLTLGALLGRFVQQRRLRAYFLMIALGLTFLVGVSRVYMGVHYPTDVLAGWTAGLAWALICWLTASALQRAGAVEKNAAD